MLAIFECIQYIYIIRSHRSYNRFQLPELPSYMYPSNNLATCIPVTTCNPVTTQLHVINQVVYIYISQSETINMSSFHNLIGKISTSFVYIQGLGTQSYELSSWKDNNYCFPYRVVPLILVLPTVESIVGISSTNNGCWCVLDFYNLRPDDGVSIGVSPQECCIIYNYVSIKIYGRNSKFNKLATMHATILGVAFIIVTLLTVVRVQSSTNE